MANAVLFHKPLKGQFRLGMQQRQSADDESPYSGFE